MNKLVNELVLKARMSTISDTPDGGKSFDLDLFHEKFAELIVLECVASIPSDGHRGDFLRAVEFCQHKIKEHFGVE